MAPARASGSARALAVPRAHLAPSARAPRRRCGSRAGAPSSSAMPASTRRSGSDVGVGEDRVERCAARPSQVTNVPALSVTGATGKTTSATRVTSVSRSSRATTNDARVERRAEGRRVGGVVGVDAADDQAAELAGVERGHDRVGVAAGASRAGCRRPRRWRRRRAPRRRRPAGRRAAGWAGSRSRPHRGRRHGAAPRRAWRRSCAASVGGGGERAGRRWPAARRPGSPPVASSRSRRRGEQASSAAASVPGRVGDQRGRPSCAGRAR